MRLEIDLNKDGDTVELNGLTIHFTNVPYPYQAAALDDAYTDIDRKNEELIGLNATVTELQSDKARIYKELDDAIAATERKNDEILVMGRDLSFLQEQKSRFYFQEQDAYKASQDDALRQANETIYKLNKELSDERLGRAISVGTDQYVLVNLLHDIDNGEVISKDQKINVIKMVRKLTGWGLRESKDLVDKECPNSRLNTIY
jgi:hypothetical protein